MIASLRGTLLSKLPTEIIVDVHGVGYQVHIPLSTFEKLPEIDAAVRLFTYLHVREDILQLFGFATEEERNLFKLLLSVNGIGPRMAQGILSGITVGELRQFIMTGNLGALGSIPGIGRKIAERLVVELREKIGKVDAAVSLTGSERDSGGQLRADALLALTSLGYNRVAAEKALHAALRDSNGKDLSLEALIKIALRHAAK